MALAPLTPVAKGLVAVSVLFVAGIVTTGVLVWHFTRDDVVQATANVTFTNGPPAPEPHVLGSRVYVFSPEDDPGTIQYVMDTYYSVLGGSFPGDFNGEFDSERVTFAFMPGGYPVSVPVGYYTQVVGLGATPEDTVIQGDLLSQNGSMGAAGALDNFWRSCENVTFQTDSTWSVSQGCSLRRCKFDGMLSLVETPAAGAAGESSGGFIASTEVTGNVRSESQQQFFTRNTDFAAWPDAVWNMVFVGCPNAPTGVCPPNESGRNAFNKVDQTPVIREKPYLTVSAASEYEIRVPPLVNDTAGPNNAAVTEVIPFANIYVAKPVDTAAVINAQLAAGKDLILTPGLYNLTAALTVTRANTVVLGLGYATLISASGNPVVEIGDVEGVKLCSVLLQAGPTNAPYLLRVGATPKGSGSASNPVLLSDVFARIGGPNTEATSITDCVIINSNFTLVDNMWLWRADHGLPGGVGWTVNTAQNGLVVNADNVTTYGLAVEHFQNLQVEWKGNNGRVYFYQSEAPYDSPTPGDYTQPNFRVSSGVTGMTMQGCGAYCFFRDSAVVQPQGFDFTGATVSANFMFTRWLNGNTASQITNVVNTTGAAVTTNSRLSYVCSFP